MGALFDPAKIAVGRRPVIDAEQAVALALITSRSHETMSRLPLNWRSKAGATDSYGRSNSTAGAIRLSWPC